MALARPRLAEYHPPRHHPRRRRRWNPGIRRGGGDLPPAARYGQGGRLHHPRGRDRARQHPRPCRRVRKPSSCHHDRGVPAGAGPVQRDPGGGTHLIAGAIEPLVLSDCLPRRLARLPLRSVNGRGRDPCGTRQSKVVGERLVQFLSRTIETTLHGPGVESMISGDFVVGEAFVDGKNQDLALVAREARDRRREGPEFSARFGLPEGSEVPPRAAPAPSNQRRCTDTMRPLESRETTMRVSCCISREFTGTRV